MVRHCWEWYPVNYTDAPVLGDIQMTRVLKVLICLCGAVYMHVRFTQGAGVPTVDIPSEYFRSIMSRFSDGMHESYRFVLYLLAFECLVLALEFVYRRFLKDRFRFAKKVCMTAMWARLAFDAACIALMLMFLVLDFLATHGRMTFELIDGKGNSTVIVSEWKILQ